MDFNTANLPIAAVLLLAWCLGLDSFIWWLNLRWDQHNPQNPRHPYSPLFTAIGVSGVCLAMLLIIPWQYVAMFFAVFVVYGGLMWILHARRYWIRNN